MMANSWAVIMLLHVVLETVAVVRVGRVWVDVQAPSLQKRMVPLNKSVFVRHVAAVSE